MAVILIVNVIAYVTFLIFPTYVPRSPVSGGIFAGWLQWIYAHDQPYNAFPSLHAALSTVAAAYFIAQRHTLAWAWSLGAAGIIASTLLVKQHYVLDALAGIALGGLASFFCFRRYSKPGWVPAGGSTPK